MSVFDRIEQATQEAKATVQSVTLHLSDEEISEYRARFDEVPGAVNSGAVPLDVQQKNDSGPLRVYLVNGSTIVSISI